MQHYASRAGATIHQGCAATGIDVATGASRGRDGAQGRSRPKRRLLRRRLVARGRRARRRRAAGRGRAPLDVVHAAGRRPAGALPLTIDFSSGFYFHREGPGLAFGGRDGSRSGRGCCAALARARRPARADVVVGLLRREPGLERPRRRGARGLALPLRDRFLGPRLPAGARGRRAHGGARRRPRADARPLGVLGRAFATDSPRPETFVV